MSEPVTLANCENEPIHIPGAIQPHGVLFACRGPELAVSQVSANVGAMLGVAPPDVLGRPLGEQIDVESAEHLRSLAAITQPDDLRAANPFRLGARNGGSFDAVAHRSGDVLIVELQPTAHESRETVGSFDPLLRTSTVRLQNARDVQRLTAVAASEVRRLTGFDRVMVYRFDADWHGHVVAEDKREDLEPFLGLHYPASDIPAQARRLYTTNPIRLIADIGYAPAPLEPVLDPVTKAPLDLSGAALRSVSPIHVEYLQNMGVSASMSISLVIDGVLAGLIACHHYSGPRIVPVPVRDTAEFIAYQLSWQLRVLEESERAERSRAAQEHEAEVVRSIAVASELLDGLDTPALLALSGATGVAVVLEEGMRRIGETPSEEAVHEIVAWLKEREDVVATSHLSSVLPTAGAWTERAGGLLSVAIARELGEFIIWFRPAIDRVVSWAGEPSKQVTTTTTGAPRLSPRGSFALWKETIRGQSLPWQRWEVDAASRLRRAILGGVRRRAVQLRSINQQLIDADRAKDDFIAMVSHELRTPLSAIMGWTTLLKRGVDANRLAYAIEVIDRNAQAQAQLIEDLLDVSRITSRKLSLDITMVDVAPLLTNVIESASLAIEAKGLTLARDIEEAVPKVRGDVVRLRQVIANLLTNAVKFTPKGGTITIRLAKSGSDVELVVTDSGQGIAASFLPHVFEAFRQQDAGMNRRSQGLGLGLAIVRHLVELHGGKITAMSEGEGLGASFTVSLPITPFHAAPADRISPPPATPKPRVELAGRRILMIEDDPDSRELIQVILQSGGATVTTANDAKSALELLATSSFDLIVSDIGLPEMDGFELMKRTRASGVKTPAVALTAFTRASDRTATLQAGFQAHVPKPVDPDELIATLVAIAGVALPAT